MTRRTLLLGALSAPFPGSQERRPQALQAQLFPQPTGQNGYEELMQAADLLGKSDAFTAAETDSKALYRLRRALDDPPVRRARTLIRQAMAKPMHSPRAGQPIGPMTLLPDLAGLRRLARLLAMETRVHFADGRSASAIQAAFDTFRLTEAIRGETLIGGLVEVACDAIALRALIVHADAWTVPDCLRLLSGARNLLQAPSLGALTLEGERRFFQESFNNILQSLTDDPKAPGELGIEPPEGEGERQADALRQRLRDPAERARFVARVRERQDALIALHLRYLADPSGDLPGPPALGESPEDRMLGVLVPAFHQAVDKFLRLQVQTQLLGVHAALRRMRWENEIYPATLAELKLEPALTTDPFTRQPLIYVRQSDVTYDLSSAGPRPRDSAAPREPIRLL